MRAGSRGVGRPGRPGGGRSNCAGAGRHAVRWAQFPHGTPVAVRADA
jgi:hypothetical protein